MATAVLLRIASTGGLAGCEIWLDSAIQAWHRLATWRLPHRGNWAVLLRSWGAVYSGFEGVRTVGAWPIIEQNSYLPFCHCEGFGAPRPGLPQ